MSIDLTATDYSEPQLKQMLIDNLEDDNPQAAMVLKQHWAYDKEIIRYEDLTEELEYIYETGFKPGLSTGWAIMDDYYTVKQKEFTLVTGIPGAGKTEFLDNVIVNMARLHKWKFGIFSAENLPYSRHAAALMEKYMRVPFLQGQVKADAGSIVKAEEFLNRHAFFINPSEDEFKVSKILEIATRLIETDHIHALIIDPWNELDHSRERNQSETEYISSCLSKIRRFARNHNIHIFIIAHPTKLQKGKDDKYPVPTPYDVAGSAHWRNKADNCISIWWDYDKPGSATFYIQKIRFKEVGKLGNVNLFYDKKTGIYSEHDPYDRRN